MRLAITFALASLCAVSGYCRADALDLPDSFATADIDKQAQLFGQKLDITDFTDPAKLSKFLTRFTSMYEINHPTSTAVSAASVLFAQPTSVGISTDLMMAMQQLKF